MDQPGKANLCYYKSTNSDGLNPKAGDEKDEIVDLTTEPNEIAFDWTFGFGVNLPGLKYLMTLHGPLEAVKGFM